MNRIEILQRITELLSDIVDNPDLTLTESTTADDVEEWDSLGHVRLIVAIESDFAIRFDTTEISTPENVGQLIDLILSKI